MFRPFEILRIRAGSSETLALPNLDGQHRHTVICLDLRGVQRQVATGCALIIG